MNIHEYQAKKILQDYGAPVSNGVSIYSLEEINEKIKKLKSEKFVLKAQIHAGGRGKAGGVKLINNLDELKIESKKMMGKILITHQTGPAGKEVKRLYIEEASDILEEYYLSCLIDRESSKIAFISSTEGGMDIEKVAIESPNKIITNKIDFREKGPSDNEIEKIISIFKFNDNQKETAKKLIKSLYKIVLEKDASLIEINPLIINKENKLLVNDDALDLLDKMLIYDHSERITPKDAMEHQYFKPIKENQQ